jgi:hypothetical protein
MEIYFPVDDINISQEIIDWWIKALNDVTLYVDLTIRKQEDINYFNNINLKKDLDREYYVFKIDFNKYEYNKRLVKITLFLIRYLWEYSGCEYNNREYSMNLSIKYAKKIQELLPEVDPIFCLIKAYTVVPQTGHYISFGGCNGINNEKFISVLKILEKFNYDNFEINDLTREIRTLITFDKLNNDYKILDIENKLKEEYENNLIKV